MYKPLDRSRLSSFLMLEQEHFRLSHPDPMNSIDRHASRCIGRAHAANAFAGRARFLSGILLTLIHNMALISPDITHEAVAYHTKAF